MDDVSSEEVDAVEFARVPRHQVIAIPVDMLNGAGIHKLSAALSSITAFGNAEDLEAAAEAVKRVAAKAMVRRNK